MNRDETARILSVMSVAFPNFRPENKAFMLSTWENLLKDFSYEQINYALTAYIRTDTTGFAPSIGQLINQISKAKHSDDLNEGEAWSLVRKALENGIYGSTKEFEKFPPLVKRAVGSPEQLRVWATDENYNESVIASNFKRAYAAAVERSKEEEKIPEQMRQLLAGTEQYLRIEGDNI